MPKLCSARNPFSSARLKLENFSSNPSLVLTIYSVLLILKKEISLAQFSMQLGYAEGLSFRQQDQENTYIGMAKAVSPLEFSVPNKSFYSQGKPRINIRQSCILFRSANKLVYDQEIWCFFTVTFGLMYGQYSTAGYSGASTVDSFV